MNIRMKHFIISFMIACMMTVSLPFQMMTAFAAEAKVSFSDTSATVGEELAVTVKVTSAASLGRAELMLAYDASSLEFVSGTNANGDAGSLALKGTADTADTKLFTFTLKFKALEAGSSQIKVTMQEIYDADGQLLDEGRKGTSAVTVKPLSTYKKDASLKSLKVSPGTLAPAFSPTVYEYNITVGTDVNKVAVSAERNDDKAKTVITGHSDLQPGENIVSCKVTAENGETTQTYTIKVLKTEGGETAGVQAGAITDGMTVIIDKVQYTIAGTFDETTLPEGFEASAFTYKGNEILAGRGLEKELTLIYLVDTAGSGSFYIYNESAGSWAPYQEISTSAKSIVILPADPGLEPEGYVPGTLPLNGRQANGWVWHEDKDPRFWLFYGMNWKGEKALYRYDLSENTIQRYVADPGALSGLTLDEYQKLEEDYKAMKQDYKIRFIIIAVLIGVCAVLSVALAAVLMKKERGRGPDDDDGEDDTKKKNRKRGHNFLTEEERFLRGEEEEMQEDCEDMDEDSYDSSDDDFLSIDDAVDDDFDVIEDLDDDFQVLEDGGDDFETLDLDQDLRKRPEQNVDDDFEVIGLDE